MNGQKNRTVLLGFVLSVSLLSTSLTAVFMTEYYNRIHFQTLGRICQEIVEVQPEVEQAVLNVLKEYKVKQAVQTDKNILHTFGYQPSDFVLNNQKSSILFVLSGFGIGGLVFLFTFKYWRRKINIRINALTDFLEKLNTGGQGVLIREEEDEFAKLQDEIYKTVTMLYQTKEEAVKAKNNYAENLSNIAHQLKTPITAISLSTQMMKKQPSMEYPDQIQRQLNRLIHLEEALLLLSRLDAGTLPLKMEAVDVFTVLTLAADNLQETFSYSGIAIDIPLMGQIEITADLDWTMEAIMNLLKDCMEHSKKGDSVHCSYEQNPLYTQIRIWDEGNGFAKEDLPHLFERFYRGKNANSDGIGIGLSLSKAIIESQNGIISAGNIPDGGACFEIRFYSH